MVLLLWNKAANDIIGKNAAEIYEKLVLSKAGDDTDATSKYCGNLSHPRDMEKIIGKEILFKIVVEAKHLEGWEAFYNVENVYMDVDLIMKHKKTDHKGSNPPFMPFKDSVGDTNWDAEDNVDLDSGDGHAFACSGH